MTNTFGIMVISGDLVDYEGRRMVVVDVTIEEKAQDCMAVLRDPEDLELMNPIAVPAHTLAAWGHLEHLEGWVESAPGVWRQT